MNPDGERRILAEIEEDLRASDPGLARRLDRALTATQTRYRRLAGTAFLALSAWLVMVSVVPVPIGAPWVKPVLVAGSAVLLVSAWWVVTLAPRCFQAPRWHRHHHHRRRSPKT